MLGAAKE